MTLLCEVEEVSSYLKREDAFFYALGKTSRKRIITSRHAALEGGCLVR